MIVAIAPRTPGRLELRRERFLEEGERLFLAKGYAGASVNEIVRLAGGSLATLYSEFGSKEGLFAAIMKQRASVMFNWNVAESPRKTSLRAALIAFARRLLERYLSDDSLAFYRISISEGPRFPELRAAILEVSLPAYFQRLGTALVELGVVDRKDSAAAAEEFVSLVHGQLVFRAACSHGASIPEKMRARHIEHAVDAFLRLHPPVSAKQQGRSPKRKLQSI
jgi:AcrR family transcriptional regulator